MIEKTGAFDVYFEESIEILVDDSDDFDVDRLREVLDEFAFECTKITERR